MSKQRLVDTCFWDDRYISRLDPSEKLLFLYLLTNPLTSICGIYQIEMRRIAFDTGFDTDTIKRMLERFEKDNRCTYRDGWLAMRNWIKHQTASPKVQKGIRDQLQTVPEELKKYIGYGIDTISHSNSNSNTNTNLNLNEQSPCAAGPIERPAAQTKSERIQEKKRLLREQAKLLGVEEVKK